MLFKGNPAKQMTENGGWFCQFELAYNLISNPNYLQPFLIFHLEVFSPTSKDYHKIYEATNGRNKKVVVQDHHELKFIIY